VACDYARRAENPRAYDGSDADGNAEASAEYAQQVSAAAARVIGAGVNANSP
jgi:hypothetical protein